MLRPRGGGGGALRRLPALAAGGRAGLRRRLLHGRQRAVSGSRSGGDWQFAGGVVAGGWLGVYAGRWR